MLPVSECILEVNVQHSLWHRPQLEKARKPNGSCRVRVGAISSPAESSKALSSGLDGSSADATDLYFFSFLGWYALTPQCTGLSCILFTFAGHGYSAPHPPRKTSRNILHVLYSEKEEKP